MGFRKTRIAPTPSGFLHLGNLYSFLLTRKLALEEKSTLLLRIDDMDQERSDPCYIEDIFSCLDFMGIAWQEGPKDFEDFESNYSQTKRLGIYNGLLEKLVRSGRVFACSCSRSDIQQNGSGIYPGTCKHKKIPLESKNVTWRLDTSESKEINIKLYRSKTESYVLPPAMKDFVIRKKDGFPAYQLCSVADDLHFGIDLIIRGQDLWESTLAQMYLAQVAGESEFSGLSFLHHPLLSGSDGKKLSKSAGDTSIQSLRKKGLNREDVLALIKKLSGVDF